MNATEPGRPLLKPGFVLCLALIGAASMIYYHQKLFIPRAQEVRRAEGLGNGYSFGNDFYQLWLASRELIFNKRDPYGPETTKAIQIGLYGRVLDPARAGDPVDQRVFPYPGFVAVMFCPVAEFPFPAVRIAALCVLIGLSVATPFLWLRAIRWHPRWEWAALICLLTVCSYPALEGLFAEQLGLLVAFLLAAAILFLRGRRFFLAGILMALTTMKPQTTALPVIYLLIWAAGRWRSRRGFILGYLLTMVLLVGTSLVILPHWIQSWAHTVVAYRHYTAPPLITEVLTSWLGTRLVGPATLIASAALVGFAFGLSWRNRDAETESFDFWSTLSVSLAITTIAVLQGQAVYDHLILIPAVLLLARYRSAFHERGRALTILFSIGTLILFWNWIAAFGLILLSPWVTLTALHAAPILAIPIRSAASLPFVVLALSVLSRRISPPLDPEGA
jgi:Glycosyltransferase family 87